jgi:hypothetical protein
MQVRGTAPFSKAYAPAATAALPVFRHGLLKKLLHT